MQITRLSLPTFTALSDQDRASWLRLDEGQDAPTINMLVSSATDYVEGITGLCLGLASYRVEFDGIDCRYRLPLAPVQSITSVEYRDLTGALQAIPDGWFLSGSDLHFTALPAGCPIVTLTAGHPDAVSVPTALRHAIAVLVSAGYNAREELTNQTITTVDRLCQRHKRFA
jgi:uncharacterized phiE125 gp8 family phage protein